MTAGEIRAKYLEFFKGRGHAAIPSASLLPENDPTTLFTGSGMQPLLPYLLGEAHPKGARLVDSQKCFRAEDIEEVGDNRHTTFFEMLGNWSLGDYFKEEQLAWCFAFLTDELGLDPARLYVTAFAGDEENGIPQDTESAEIWKRLFAERGIDAREAAPVTEAAAAATGMRGCRIFYYDASKNWWSRAGGPADMPLGEPGGPDSEVFFDFDPSAAMHDTAYGEHCHPNCDCGRFLEIGNSVFMEYRKETDGSFAPLPQKNVDFGGGLERIAAAVNDTPDVFRIDLLRGTIAAIEHAAGVTYGERAEETAACRIVADHLRGAVFMIADGAAPSNTDAGYIVRRLLRRAVRFLDRLGVERDTLHTLVPAIAEKYRDAYPALSERAPAIAETVREEEAKFRRTLAKGLREFERFARSGEITGEDAFTLFSTYGFPIEMTEELARERGIAVDTAAFDAALLAHRERSRAGARRKFKGGLADTSEQSVRYHTATHLLHQALRDVLGNHVRQKGSNITPERLRFDFAFDRKLTDEEKRRVEEIVNEKIAEGLSVTHEDIPREEARERGAIGLFEEKYGDTVRVYAIAESETGEVYSLEYCGGPHVANTSELGRFKIAKEEAVGEGVRRIRAALE